MPTIYDALFTFFCVATLTASIGALVSLVFERA
jgi:hypothetical protein